MVFYSLVFVNYNHLGPLNTSQATLINLGVVAVLILLQVKKNFKWMFILLSVPVFLTGCLAVFTNVQRLFQNLFVNFNFGLSY